MSKTIYLPEVTITPSHKKGGKMKLILKHQKGNKVIDNDTIRLDGKIYKVNDNKQVA